MVMYNFLYSVLQGVKLLIFFGELEVEFFAGFAVKVEVLCRFTIFSRHHLEGRYFLTQKLFLSGSSKICVWEDQRNTIKKSSIGLFFLSSKD